MATTGFLFHPAFLDHQTAPGHPERPERLSAILDRLTDSGLLAELAEERPTELDPDRLGSVHDPGYVGDVRRRCAAGEPVLDTGDTSVSIGSYRAASLAAGAAVTAVDRVHEGRWKHAFVACRPPGHHAEVAQAMGFCLFNNAAVAAEHARSRWNLERVAVIDWDVHHGNGTQHIFERDPGVYYVSLHQWPFYPGTGGADERGLGEGTGTTLNCPMSAGSGDDHFLRAFDQQVLPALDAWRPELVIISAGFDAHRADPLGGLQVTEDGYREMTRRLLEIADGHSGGRVVSLLEGGYDFDALASSVETHLAELRSWPAPPGG